MDLFNFNNKSQNGEESAYSRLYKEVKRLCSLEVENAKLMLAEKLTLLLGRVALAAVCFVISAAALIFLSIAVADFLLSGLEPSWTYLIIGGFYVFLIILIIGFRRRLIVDPIARFISQVILDPPSKTEHSENSSPSNQQPIVPVK